MPDPIDELENFTNPGLTMNPLPASEVRRRGTRLRRRNNALAAIGGVAVVAIIATPLAMAASNDRTDTTPPPADHSPTVTWVHEIPAGFPLDQGLPQATTSATYEARADADACTGLGWSAQDPATVAVSQAVQQESEGGWDRTLALYADADTASSARLALQDRVEACAASTAGKGRSTEVVSTDADTLVYADHVSDAGEMFTHQVVQVGNALLLDTAYSIGAPAQTTADLIEQKSAPVVDAMCAFAADPC